jgi:hypothetical protein
MTPQEIELKKIEAENLEKQLAEQKANRNMQFIHIAQSGGAKTAKEVLDYAKELKKFTES